MKKKIYQYSILIVILLGFTSTAKGQFRETKEFKKAIKVSTAGRLAVSNRHGNINNISFLSDSSIVKATISGQSKSLGKLNESMN